MLPGTVFRRHDNPKSSFRDKVVLITGGGSGIGAACAHRFASEGAHVCVLGRRRASIEQVAASVGGLAIAADASSAVDMRVAIQSITERFGGLDVLIANAGGHGLGDALNTDDDSWSRARRGKPGYRIRSRARISAFDHPAPRLPLVLVSSIAALAAGADVCGYTTFKHAMIGLTRSLARDYGPLGVRVNSVCPGWVRTPMADAEMQALMDSRGLSLDEAYALVTADVPLRRPADPEDIAAVCRFLASDEARIITGAVIVADGGAAIVDVPTLAFSRLASV